MSQAIGEDGLGWSLELLEDVTEFASRYPEAAVEWDRLNPLGGLDVLAVAFVVQRPPPTPVVERNPFVAMPDVLPLHVIRLPPILWVKVDVLAPPWPGPVPCVRAVVPGETIAYEWITVTGHWHEVWQAEIPNPQRGEKCTAAWYKLRGFRHSAATLLSRGALRKFARAGGHDVGQGSFVADIIDSRADQAPGHVALDPSEATDPWPNPPRYGGKSDTGSL